MKKEFTSEIERQINDRVETEMKERLRGNDRIESKIKWIEIGMKEDALKDRVHKLEIQTSIWMLISVVSLLITIFK